MVYIDYEGSWVFFPREPDFLSWYTRWLRDTANGYKRIGWFATDLEGDEAELRRRYQCAETEEERWLALASMQKFPELSPESAELIRTAMAAVALRQSDPALLLKFLNVRQGRLRIPLILKLWRRSCG